MENIRLNKNEEIALAKLKKALVQRFSLIDFRVFEG